jgi:hypothetical protein
MNGLNPFYTLGQIQVFLSGHIIFFECSGPWLFCVRPNSASPWLIVVLYWCVCATIVMLSLVNVYLSKLFQNALVFAKTELYTILYRICQNNRFSIFIKKFMLGHYVYDNGDIDIQIIDSLFPALIELVTLWTSTHDYVLLVLKYVTHFYKHIFICYSVNILVTHCFEHTVICYWIGISVTQFWTIYNLCYCQSVEHKWCVTLI